MFMCTNMTELAPPKMADHNILAALPPHFPQNWSYQSNFSTAKPMPYFFLKVSS